MAVFTLKDPGDVRDDILRTLKNGLIARGVANPQLGPGSNEYVLATAIANEIAVVSSNTQIKADAQMPDTAVGSDLDRICAVYGLTRSVAGPSTGFVILQTSAITFIPFGTQLTDSIGLRYSVTLGGSYANGDQVPITAIDTGRQTDHEANDVLRWVTTPAYAANIALVTSVGLTGGIDAEGDENLRTRLLSRLQNPPNNCNWNQIAAIAESSSTAIQKAFVYPAVNGPSTVHVAVTAPPQLLSASVTTLVATAKNRDVSSSIMANTVIPTIQGQLPEYVESVITTVTNVPNDVSIGLALPNSPAAVPAGPGGGWIDGQPWPTTSTQVTVTSVTSSTVFATDAATSATIGNHIAFLDSSNWQLYRAKVISVSGATITIDTPFPTVAAGGYIFPDAVNAQAYVDAILNAFGQLGPGEKTMSSGNLTRGYRHPTPQNSWQHTLNYSQLRTISDVGEEVLDVQWLNRTSSAAPAVPGSVASPPNIFVPRYLGFYPLT